MTATIPADDVTTKGLDYFIHAFDGHTNAYSPGTAYVATQHTRVDGTRTHFFHVHVREPIRYVHEPVTVAHYREAVELTATVNCATRDCEATMAYRTLPPLGNAFDTLDAILDYADGEPPFTLVDMDATVVEDLGEEGTVLEYTATIPSEAVTTEGVDYWLHFTDGHTNAYYPGTSYIAAYGAVDGERAAWQHIEVLVRPLLTHQPHATFSPGDPLRMEAVYLTSVDAFTATLFYRHDGDPTYISQPMVIRQTPVRADDGSVYVATGAIPSAFTTEERGIEYYIVANDGHQNAYSIATAPDIGHLVLVRATVGN